MVFKYDATMMHTFIKTNKNLTVLYYYILHMLFTFELVNKPNFIEKEVYFINSGYEDFSLLKSNKEM